MGPFVHRTTPSLRITAISVLSTGHQALGTETLSSCPTATSSKEGKGVKKPAPEGCKTACFWGCPRQPVWQNPAGGDRGALPERPRPPRPLRARSRPPSPPPPPRRPRLCPGPARGREENGRGLLGRGGRAALCRPQGETGSGETGTKSAWAALECLTVRPVPFQSPKRLWRAQGFHSSFQRRRRRGYPSL